jgi:hypothetical protein
LSYLYSRMRATLDKWDAEHGGWNSRWKDEDGVVHAVWINDPDKRDCEVVCRAEIVAPFYYFISENFEREEGPITCLICISKTP